MWPACTSTLQLAADRVPHCVCCVKRAAAKTTWRLLSTLSRPIAPADTQLQVGSRPPGFGGTVLPIGYFQPLPRIVIAGTDSRCSDCALCACVACSVLIAPGRRRRLCRPDSQQQQQLPKAFLCLTMCCLCSSAALSLPCSLFNAPGPLSQRHCRPDSQRQ